MRESVNTSRLDTTARVSVVLLGASRLPDDADDFLASVVE